MASFSFTFIVAIIAVALLILGLSLTLMVKGHNIKSEIGENDEMKRRGIKCAAQQMREEEARLTGKELSEIGGCGDKSCETCVDACSGEA